MPKGIPLTEEELKRRRHEIFRASVGLFLEKGFRETSMREIAEAAKMGKSSLYDYFKTKEEILVWFVEDVLTDLAAATEEIVKLPLPADERLRQVMRKQFESLIANKDFYLKISFEVQRLSIESQRQIQVRRHAYQDMLRDLVAEGIRAGIFRPVDELLVARALISIQTPTVFTSRPSGSPEQMIDTAFDIVFNGIRA